MLETSAVKVGAVRERTPTVSDTAIAGPMAGKVLV
jgi:hypothetical protein